MGKNKILFHGTVLDIFSDLVTKRSVQTCLCSLKYISAQNLYFSIDRFLYFCINRMECILAF